MKTLIPILENPIYSRILFAINGKEVYASELVKKLNKTQATIQRQLTILKEEKFICVKEHPKKKKNIQLFYINWEKIIDEFFKQLFKKISIRYNEIMLYFKDIPEGDSYSESEIKITIKKDYKKLREYINLKDINKNEALINILKNLFETYDKIIVNSKKDYITINQTFNDLQIYLEGDYEILSRDLDKDKLLGLKRFLHKLNKFFFLSLEEKIKDNKD
jgi:DNA-binding transcriptional ArsR family regulator